MFVLGDDASISYGSFMGSKHLCVLIHIRTKGEVSWVFPVDPLVLATLGTEQGEMSAHLGICDEIPLPSEGSDCLVAAPAFGEIY